GRLLRRAPPVEADDGARAYVTDRAGKSARGRSEDLRRRSEPKEIVVSPRVSADFGHKGERHPGPTLVGRRGHGFACHHAKLNSTKHLQSKRHDIHRVGATSRKRTAADTGGIDGFTRSGVELTSDLCYQGSG